MKRTLNLIITALIALVSWAQTDTLSLPDVVVTGARTVTDVRHLPMTVTVINHQDLTAWHRDNVLPAVSEQVPGLFVSGRAMMGYGVSGGAAGGINMRGISGGSGQLLVLIDGHPQFNGIYGHPISDSYQTLLAERVEVLRGPASVLYGSNAMGGVINIVTRQAKQDGSSTDLSLSAGAQAVSARSKPALPTDGGTNAYPPPLLPTTVAPTITDHAWDFSNMADMLRLDTTSTPTGTRLLTSTSHTSTPPFPAQFPLRYGTQTSG